MEIRRTDLADVLLFVPAPHHDDRGLFTRTFDADIAAAHGLDPDSFRQDSQSRSRAGVLRGMHGRIGRGEAKLVRCARGAVHDVLVDIRPGSPTFGRHQAFRLDDETFACLYVPPGFLHGFQVLSETADVCYRIDRPHDPAEDVAVRYDDPDLAIPWPHPVTLISPRDAAAGPWSALRDTLR
ncbi:MULTISPECIES: dTDP-4-dehydrorhamnose 3,5-epimerase [unclassified Crossiella]|uniref:dTDP-4-dehydrorhamnose 3,5-epimerase family protein n=1 Tax=unclassified Crossiella TaxID=2620835 RepID=UPI001FFFC36B|nr:MULTISPECIES: dTDP-4-dehydrorhamnose 3,5-epimerase [unclassified Crossiella]MCK2240823.1 dTDP-4-dehydrorhamnose 3,5-epimerase [Crossiella sp. S99.2]MCK2254033.1 dTDP-4-dehydrorhamnose 3,5-epimerase [Crossiella sp. S99.1]